MIRFIFLGVLSFALLGGTCDGPQPILSAQLEHLSSGAMVSCDPYVSKAGSLVLQQRTCLVLANPLRASLRVFDVSEGNFILSPIAYSPLAVRINGMTSRLVSSEGANQAYVFGLDTNSPDLFALNAFGGSDFPSFSYGTTSRFSLNQRPMEIFAAGSDIDGNPRVLTGLPDGSLRFNTFYPETKQWNSSEVAGVLANVSELAFDSESGLVAQLVSGSENSVKIRSIADENFVFPPINNVGSVKLALGTLKTNGSYGPHLLLMRQDEPKLRIIRLDLENQQSGFDETITLASKAHVAHFPKTAEPVESLQQSGPDWFAVGSENGVIYFISAAKAAEPSPSSPNYVQLDLAQVAGAQNASGLVQILGGSVKVLTGEQAPKDRTTCPRQLLFVFATGAVVSVCEGSLNGASLIVGRGVR